MRSTWKGKNDANWKTVIFAPRKTVHKWHFFLIDLRRQISLFDCFFWILLQSIYPFVFSTCASGWPDIFLYTIVEEIRSRVQKNWMRKILVILSKPYYYLHFVISTYFVCLVRLWLFDIFFNFAFEPACFYSSCDMVKILISSTHLIVWHARSSEKMKTNFGYFNAAKCLKRKKNDLREEGTLNWMSCYHHRQGHVLYLLNLNYQQLSLTEHFKRASTFLLSI